MTTGESPDLTDDEWMVRGIPEPDIVGGKIQSSAWNTQRVSANRFNKAGVADLFVNEATFPKFGIVTVKLCRSVGVQVEVTPTPDNPNHVDLLVNRSKGKAQKLRSAAIYVDRAASAEEVFIELKALAVNAAPTSTED